MKGAVCCSVATVIVVAASVWACKSVSPDAGTKEAEFETTASEIHYLDKLTSLDDYQRLIRNDPATRTTFVKITIDHRAPGEPVYFQNTALYPFHQQFLSAEVERFRGRTFTMDEILFGGTKEISGGALYYAADLTLSGIATPGVFGFSLYFDMLPNGDTNINVDEIKTAYAAIQRSVPFAKEKVAFLFDRSKDWFAYKAKLDALRIPNGRVQQVVGRGETTTIYSPAKSYGIL